MREPSSNGQSTSRTLLLVEDNDIYRQVVCAALQRRFPAWKILSASSLASARQIIGATRLDVVVTDLSLPDGSGVELVPLLAGNRANGLKVIALTNEALGDVVTGLRAKGYHGFVSKEHGIKALGDAVETVLTGKEFVSEFS